MSVEQKSALLTEKLTELIGSFSKNRRTNKRKALYLKLSITALGGATTVLLGLQGVERETLVQNIALVFSALVTLLAAWDTFYNHRGLWVRYTETVNRLRDIEARHEYLQAGGTDALKEDDLDALFERIRQTLRETDAWWQELRREPPTEGGA